MANLRETVQDGAKRRVHRQAEPMRNIILIAAGVTVALSGALAKSNAVAARTQSHTSANALFEKPRETSRRQDDKKPSVWSGFYGGLNGGAKLADP
jgi:hypothetical protein